MPNRNPNCSGGHCAAATGTVKIYPLGGGANMILCRACWSHENEYRRQRGRETGAPERFPVLDWATAEPYGDCACGHPWERHVQTPNGSFACRHHSCSCRDVVRP